MKRAGRALLLAGCLPALLCLWFAGGCAWYDAHRERLESRAGAEAATREHARFRGQTGWRSRTYRNPQLLERADSDNVSMLISLPDQRGYLLVNDLVALDFPVATGKRSHPTPAGEYTILQMEREYASNLYGTIYDADGEVYKTDADIRRSEVPEGGRFAGADMPYWMRLTNTGIGMHVGYVPGRPASHGCIRLRRQAAQTVFSLVRLGTPVRIVNTPFDPETGHLATTS